MDGDLARYAGLLQTVKERITGAQTRAVSSVNREMLLLYWDVGKLIHQRQQSEGWGKEVVPRLSRDIRNELPDVKGFSERNLKRMVRFYREYPTLPKTACEKEESIVPTALAQLEAGYEGVSERVLDLPWAHNYLLMEKVKDLPSRLWYMQQTLTHGWSHRFLAGMIKNRAHERQGQAVTNFDELLEADQSELAQQALKDPYVFDFLTLDGRFREKEIEAGLVKHLEQFLMELGVGFAFVGRQYHLSVGGDDFYLDLLFYHLELRCYVVVEMKVGPFKPDHAGKMNFYLNVVDDLIRKETDNPSIGMILCQDRKRIVAEYALRGMNNPIGVSEYELTRSLPDELKSSLPGIADIEAELSRSEDD